jgi:hypothetical protein
MGVSCRGDIGGGLLLKLVGSVGFNEWEADGPIPWKTCGVGARRVWSRRLGERCIDR